MKRISFSLSLSLSVREQKDEKLLDDEEGGENFGRSELTENRNGRSIRVKTCSKNLFQKLGPPSFSYLVTHLQPVVPQCDHIRLNLATLMTFF